GLLRLTDGFDLFAVHFAVHEDGRARGVVVPHVVVDHLIAPFDLAGFGVHRDDRRGPLVVARAFGAVVVRRGVGGREEQGPGFRVDGRRVPDAGAAVLVGAVLRPGVSTGFARAGDHVGLP